MDLGDVPRVVYSPDKEHPRRQNLHLVTRVVEEVTRAVERALARGAWPLVVGGDCTVTIGVVAAMAKRFPDLSLMYCDGDADLNTPDTTISGILDGMVLAHLLGEGSPELSHVGPRHPLLEEGRITLFGYSPHAGGLDPVEIQRLQGTHMATYPLEAIRSGVREAAGPALREMEERTNHILVHFDVDVMDTAGFPAVDVAHSPGLSRSQAQEALEVFLASPKVVGLVVTEFNAGQDPDRTLAPAADRLDSGGRRPAAALPTRAHHPCGIREALRRA